MSGTTEAFARVKIDDLLKDAGWDLTDGSSGPVRARVARRHAGRLRALRPAGPADGGAGGETGEHRTHYGAGPGRHYAEQLGVPFVFLSNGEEVRFLDRETDAHAREIAGFYAQDDLERRDLRAAGCGSTCRRSPPIGRSSTAITR